MATKSLASLARDKARQMRESQGWMGVPPSLSPSERTADQRLWDSAVLATAELARRISRNEDLAFALLQMTTNPPEVSDGE